MKKTKEEMNEEDFSSKLYQRVLQSYDEYNTRKNQRSKIWRLAAVWISVFLTSGAAIWQWGKINQFPSTSGDNAQVFYSENTIKKIILPDSSVVVLQQNSALHLAGNYNNDKREVYLTGNAFFEVAKSKTKPFIVHSKHLETEVLGTRFFISAIEPADRHSVLLEEGKVVVRLQDVNTEHTLKPNEKLTYSASKKEAQVKPAYHVHLNMENGSLELDGADISILQQVLFDYYGIELIDTNTQYSQVQYKMKLKAQMKATEIAKLIGAIANRPTTVQQNKINIK
ncbi:FecR family protein [Sphingobacterium sp. LRF_L2]|uniref:FecR family protein n=1 Tax=Sphingobacterium sp. LRF_L2 TaxID=3369421 RepID=UPI003F6380AA